MWSSIKEIIKPDNLSEASVLLQKKGSVLFAGGSYLVSQKDPQIHTLIDINHLINDTIEMRGENLHIHTGCTLQEIVNSNDERLNSAILASCPSKNIRNQRTIGGEIANFRTDSDLLIFLFTAGTQLVLSQSESPIQLSKWDGEGIILEVVIPKHEVKMERVALLDSAPAFVIVGLNNLNGNRTACVGGKTSSITHYHTMIQPSEAGVRKFMDEVEASFNDDHLGSSIYKRKLVGTLIQEMEGVR